MALSETWFLDGYIDFELQKYKLLGYLQEVNQQFNANRLYPQLGDIIFHYRNLEDFKKNKQLLQEGFPKELSKIDTDKLELVYRKMQEDDEVMAELEQIITYAIAKMKKTIASGTEIYELVEGQLQIEPVGIVPLYKNEGYLLLHYSNEHIVRAYNYAVSMLHFTGINYTAVQLNHIEDYKKNLTISYNSIKTELVRKIRTLPNPAVYHIESGLSIPLHETLLPIAKRILVRQVGTA